MKILAYDHFKPETRKESVTPDLLREEMLHAWRLQKTGIIREIYGRTDAPGAVITFECDSIDELKAHLAAFPLAQAGFIEWDFMPLTAPLAFEVLFAR